MYNFSCFKEKDNQEILNFIDEYPFAFLTGSFSSGEQVATQIPVLLVQKDDELYFQGHIMRNTDHHKAFIENPSGLLVFTGPSCYVSASWYSNPQNGSTWNYMSVHVKGNVKFMSDAELVDFMRRLTLKFEKGNVQSQTFYNNLPEQYLSKMMPAIVGFEIKADRLENVFKLSQNRDEKSYDNIISKLKLNGPFSEMIATEMIKRKSALFPEAIESDSSGFDS